MSSLRLQGKTEDAHRATHGTYAQREDLQTGARVMRKSGSCFIIDVVCQIVRSCGGKIKM